MVSDEQYRSIDWEMRRLKESLDRSDVDIEKLLHHLREANAKRFIGDVIPMVPLLRFRTKNVELVNGLSCTPEAQVKNVRQWNITYNWEFTEKDFRELPDAPAHPKAATILVPYLDSPLATVQGLIRALGAVVPVHVEYDVERSLTPKRFELFGKPSSRGLRWETIQLDAQMPDGAILGAPQESSACRSVCGGAPMSRLAVANGRV